MLAPGLQVPATITKLSTRNVFEYQIRSFRVQVGLMQGDDVGMGAHLAQHLNFSVSRERIGFGQHDGERDLAESFLIPSTVSLLTRALPDQIIDTVAAGEKRVFTKRNLHNHRW